MDATFPSRPLEATRPRLDKSEKAPKMKNQYARLAGEDGIVPDECR
jgi:hypothetical protein